jgi:nifR3 family TIM-barrel protein
MLKTLEKPAKTSLKIRNQTIYPNVFPAPMSGVSDRNFRRLCKQLAQGRIGYLVTEFVSVESGLGLNPNKRPQLKFFDDEHPICIQIFGRNPSNMAQGALEAEQLGADFVEINCGCPVPKVAGKGGGAGLLKEIPKIAQIIREIKKTLSVPLFMKVRLGWCDKSINVFETLNIAESEGVELFTVHGRTRMQGYNGLADWDIIGEVKSRAKIPIIGNGDVASVEMAIERINTYGVDGICVGRAAMHNPWIFSQIADHWEEMPIKKPDLMELESMLNIYASLLKQDNMADSRILGRLKQMTARFVKCMVGADEFRKNLLRSVTTEDFFRELQIFFAINALSADELFRPERLLNLNGTDELDISYQNEY